MKVAFINNMNNNFLSMVYYLRDAGIDAHLYCLDQLPKNFQLEDMIKSRDYIHDFTGVFSLKKYFYRYLKPSFLMVLHELKKELSKFDIIIACGWLFWLDLLNITVDVFIPYGSDLTELCFLDDTLFKKRGLTLALLRRLQKRHLNAFFSSKSVVSIFHRDEAMMRAIKKLGKSYIPMDIPMVYPYPLEGSIYDRQALRNIHKLVSVQHKFLVGAPSRHVWDDKKSFNSKHNDIAIKGFAKFLKSCDEIKRKSCFLIFCEYGEDVHLSNALIKKLKIEENVIWLPLLSRLDIYYLLNLVDVVLNSFNPIGDGINGVALEAFIMGRPVITNTVVSGVVAHQKTSPALHAMKPEQIAEHLFALYSEPSYLEKQSQKVQQWFHANNGKSLIDQYIILLEKINDKRSV